MPRVTAKKVIITLLAGVTWLLCYNTTDDTPGDMMSMARVRGEYLANKCRVYRVNTRSEWASLYRSKDSVNRCTNIHFAVNNKQFSICNVLKGGSLSWKQFFLYYHIPHTFLDDCKKTANCPNSVHSKIVQVRHPFERLLSTWRHIFKGGGWKLLEKRFLANPELANLLASEYGKITWEVFIRILVLKGSVEVPDITDYDAPWVWIR